MDVEVFKSVLIIGCNRGLGLELVRYLLNVEKPPQFIFATCRDLDACSALKAYNVFWNTRKTKVKVLQLDVNNDSEIAAVVSNIEQDLAGVGLSVLINNAESHTIKDLDALCREDMRKTYETNAVSPIMIAKAFRSILWSFVLLNSKDVQRERNAVIVNISSVMGSISCNKRGGQYPYRTSKAALNMATRCLSADLKENKIIVFSLHPRNVPNKMEKPLSYNITAPGIIKFISTADVSKSGGFYAYDGMPLPF